MITAVFCHLVAERVDHIDKSTKNVRYFQKRACPVVQQKILTPQTMT